MIMKFRLLTHTLIFISTVVLLSACNKNDNTSLDNVQVHFEFKHLIDGETIAFDTIKYTNAHGNAYSVATLQYFVSDITLEKIDGNKIKFDEAHYVDGREEHTHTYTPEMEIEEGEYASIAIIFGLNAEKNERGRFPNPPENNMEWPLAMGAEYGYHYMKLEGKHDSAGIIKNFQAHTGPTNGNQNFIDLEIDNSAFTIDKQEITIELVMHINNWWKNPNALDLNDITGIMGNQQMQENLKANGANVFSMNLIE